MLIDKKSLIDQIELKELTQQTCELTLWEKVPNLGIDDIAKFMCYGGPTLPSVADHNKRKTLLSRVDSRPDKKYWQLVKDEMIKFLCKEDQKYKGLWKKIYELEEKNSKLFVAVMSSYIGEKIGVEGVLLTGFISVCLYGVAKIGIEAFCESKC